jgi:hypothetical protein
MGLRNIIVSKLKSVWEWAKNVQSKIDIKPLLIAKRFQASIAWPLINDADWLRDDHHSNLI